MRILQINNCYYRRGGADVVYLNTGELLERKGNEVFYFSQKSKNNLKYKNENLFVNEVDYFNKSFFYRFIKTPRFFYSFESAKKLKFIIKEFKPEVAHIHVYKGALTPSILKVLKHYSIPSVISLHDYGLLCPHNSFLDGKENVCTKCFKTGNSLNCIKNKCNRNNLILSTISTLEFNFHKTFFPFSIYFSHFIAVSKFSHDLHLKKTEFTNKISFLYNFFPGLKEIVPSITTDRYFLFYGRLSFEKGIITLLKAWKQVDKNNILKIAGDGPQKEEILDFIKDNNLNNVQYIGFMQKKDLFDVIQNASFIIVPSQWYENNPLTIVEAYAYGKPVIGSRIGGIPEIIVEDKTGFLFEMGNHTELANAINRATSLTQDNYRNMSKEARSFALKNFSEDIHYESLMNIYKQLI